jgi:serine/threonine protein kinase/tetratricopeptide (TPR) repeat protein
MDMSLRQSESQQEGRIAVQPGAQNCVQFLDPSGSLATEQVDEMVAAWRRGERPLAEEFLARHPDLSEDAAIRLIYEEVCLRHEAGIPVTPDEIARRFPRWRQELEALLDFHQLVEAEPLAAELAFPEEGESLAGFRLVLELGRGSAGRVFLAVQPSLADRPVVLKITHRGRDEHLALARLQHMNIVPIYSEHVLQARDLHIMCMPFLGGATLSQLLEVVKTQAVTNCSGKTLIDALDHLQAKMPSVWQTGGPLRQFLASCSYVESICVIGAGLADGLHYAHERDLLHMDVKPSNVLIAGDGQPMLLDFHLAQRPIGPGSPAPLWSGGTPGYMSPEQWDVMTAVREGRPVLRAVDRRTDIYALGALLYEALGGALPDSPGRVMSPVCRFNSNVSAGLSDIIQKCLCNRPGDRYSDAAAVASDLRRHLSSLPLQGVANRSLLERWRKWRRRRPRALSRGVIGLVLTASLLVAAGSLALSFRQRIRDADSSLAQGRALLEQRRFPEARDVLTRGRSLVEGTPGFSGRRAMLSRELALANRGVKVDELHRVADLIRLRYGLAVPPLEEAQSLIRLGDSMWKSRDDLVRPLSTRGQPAVDATTRADFIDLLVLWCDIRVRYAPASEAVDAKRENLRILSEAEALLGPSPSVARLHQVYAHALGLAQRTSIADFKPRTAWEHFDLGKSYLRSDDLTHALCEFQAGVSMRPQDFWLNFYEGLSDYRLGHYKEAQSAFRAAIALSPESAECHYNRGLTYQALGRLDLAVADYDRALELNANFPDAALNRGMVHFRLGRPTAARDDLDRALALGPNRNMRGIIYYNLALLDMAGGNRESSDSHLRQAVELGNSDAIELSRRSNR